ncbi:MULTISPECIES: nuclease-related domain-containing DEAD/DEAH box helicase [Parafrankia]|nr:AAA family ATPase [Parafrankia sp. CH37]
MLPGTAVPTLGTGSPQPPAAVTPTTSGPVAGPRRLPEPSALGQAVLLGMEIAGVERQIQHLSDTQRQLSRHRRRWEAGGRAEQNVARALLVMEDAGWHVLPDRRWPGTRRANIDVILAGSGGVFVVDVKNWREAAIERGRLWRGDADADDDIRKLADQAAAVAEVLADAGLPPTEVVALLVLAGRRNIREPIDEVTVLGEYDLARELARRGARLTPDMVERLLEQLEHGCPPMPRAADPVVPRAPAAARPPTPRRDQTDPPIAGGRTSTPKLSARTAPSDTDRPDPGSSPGQSWAPGQGSLLSRDELWRELLDAADREPIETWMTWLHPTQARLAGRRLSGPARVRGPAGTGKTVVALHRAKHLATRGDRVLFTSLVRTLGPVYRALLTRMAPDHVERIEFTNVHAVAARCLRDHGLSGRHQQDAADTCFWRAWAQVGRNSVLPDLGLGHQYWRDEIATVIKGRGLTSYSQYASLARVGRSTPLQPTHRRAVWDLYERYERLRTERKVLDRDDVLLLARDLVRASSETPYDAVIVDEVQDLTCVGLQLLHAFVGDKPDGLLVVGDGQQSIYPGGFTLAEAGVPVVGRSTVLTRNYRNRAEILRYAQTVIVDDSFDDLDGTPEHGRREVDIDRPGGEIAEVTVPDAAAQDAALCAHLTQLHDNRDARYGDMAVLVSTNEAESRWLRVLAGCDIPAVSLKQYDGTSRGFVKIGTYHRAKALDFAHVCIPDRNLFPGPRRASESADAFHERTRLERRQLYVAITRARDSVWAGIRQGPDPGHPRPAQTGPV